MHIVNRLTIFNAIKISKAKNISCIVIADRPISKLETLI